MIRLRVNEQDLDIGEAQVNIEIQNPLFQSGSIPGILSLPFNIPYSPTNQIALGFPEIRARQAVPQEPIRAQLFIQDLLWREGILTLQGGSESAYTLNFQSDAGELQSRIVGVQLSDIDFGDPEPVQLQDKIYPDANHILFPVRNDGFYDGKRTGYQGYLNYYKGGFGQAQGLTPFPYLVFVLRKALGQFGYRITGNWIGLEEIRRLVLFSNAALDAEGGGTALVDYSRHVPDIQVGEFLVALQNMFGLGFIFSPVRREVEIVTLREVIGQQEYVERTEQAARYEKWDLPQQLGFKLSMTPDDLDELTKKQNSNWASFQVGNGSEPITTKASTLFMVREEDRRSPGRNWLIPHTETKGSSPGYGLVDNRCRLRILSYRGLQPDSQGTLYPLGTSGTGNYAGTEIGAMGLLWDGSKGLYQRCWKDWLDFRANSRQEDRTFRLTGSDLLAIDYKEKWMVEHLKFIWEKLSVAVSVKDGLKEAKVELHQVRL